MRTATEDCRVFFILMLNFGSLRHFTMGNGDTIESVTLKSFKGNIPIKPNYSLTLTAKPDPFEAEDPVTQAKVILRSDLFRSDQAQILYYAFLITEHRNAFPAEHGFWNSTSYWPPLPNWENASVPHQVTPARWNPFSSYSSDSYSTAVYVIGDGSFEGTYYWNKPLTKKTKYAFKIRAFTDSGFQDTDIIYFETLENLPVVHIVSILFILWMITITAVCSSIFNFEWMKSLMATSGRKSKDYFSPVPGTFSHKSFLKYAENLLNNPGRLGNEFHLLGTLSSDVSTLCLHAQRVDNKMKNRYGNILPFDMTRVKLSVIDDDPSTDYINASFIKGYTQEVEYIACQGPKTETCHDFFRMIIEQNVKVIVMLTDLMENGKEKCCKYYPDEGQIKEVGDISVSCCADENFGFFQRRELTVLRNEKKIKLIQFHYKEWKDFVCPQSTTDLLKFCGFVREIPRDDGCVVVHCSAGAGRTGTFIAVDILLQQIRHNKKMSVFDTVLKLRQQRVGMVQTEVQLGFIYECAYQAIAGRGPSKTKGKDQKEFVAD